MDLDFPLAILFPAAGLGAALYALWRAHRQACRQFRDPASHPALGRAFGIMSVAMVGYAIALPTVIIWLPAGAREGMIVALSGGFAWTLAAQALRLRSLAAATEGPRPALAIPHLPGVSEGWVGLGATLVGLGLAIAAALFGGLIAALH